MMDLNTFIETFKEKPATVLMSGALLLFLIVVVVNTLTSNSSESDGPPPTPAVDEPSDEPVDEPTEDVSDVRQGDADEQPDGDTNGDATEGAESDDGDTAGADADGLRERWGDEAAEGLWSPERPDGLPAADWWRETIGLFWVEGDESTYTPPGDLLLEAWTDPEQSDLPADVAEQLAEEAMAVATAEFRVDYEARATWPEMFGQGTGGIREDPAWVGWEPVGAAAATVPNMDDWAYVLVVWDADVDPYTSSAIRRERASRYLFLNTGDGWEPRPCTEATQAGVPSACSHEFG